MSHPEYTRSLAIRIGLTDVPALLAECEQTADVVWLSRSCECDRLTLRGVPAKRVDVLIEHRLRTEAEFAGLDSRDSFVAEVGRKAGRFDGTERDRLTVRVMRARDAAQHPVGRLNIECDGDRVTVALSDGTGIRWEGMYTALRSDLDGYSGGRLIWWHARRYYGFLVAVAGDDVRGLAERWDARDLSAEFASLAEANRAASRELYRLARDLGWRKLTARERRNLDLHSEAQWVSSETYDAAQSARNGYCTAGDASDRGATAGAGGLVIDEAEIIRRWPDEVGDGQE